ncbi:hypothetical protein SAMN06272741_5782 [Streptomyces sp. 2114.4]|nr:hypothetical protein SAMN06272741_5782 [Streptomyces sp. 2114.4]
MAEGAFAIPAASGLGLRPVGNSDRNGRLGAPIAQDVNSPE